jgi:hypothetical protein
MTPRKTIAHGDGLGDYKPVFFTTLSTEQRETFAAWIVRRLSECMLPKEVREVLKQAQRRVAAGRGKPGKWRGATGIQMVREVQAIRSTHPAMTEAEAIEMLIELCWMQRFGENTEIVRRYYEAKAYMAGRSPKRKRAPLKKKRATAVIAPNIRTVRPAL